jgi:hypothetical protein
MGSAPFIDAVQCSHFIPPHTAATIESSLHDVQVAILHVTAAASNNNMTSNQIAYR